MKKYYTDAHDVDEDKRTITEYGGQWYSDGAGITFRGMNGTVVDSGDHVASDSRHPKLIICYTDHHDVDENTMTISFQGGYWTDGSKVGITHRHAGDPTDCTYPWVASICRHPKLIKYYTDAHDVDEDLRTIASCNGNWPNENLAGVTFRHMNDIHTNTYNFVASVQKK